MTTRRAFLGGAAAMITLPFLPSLETRGDDKPPLRLLWYFIPNGAVMADWRPAQVGPGWAPSRILSPLADLTADVSVISGLQNLACVSSVRAAHSQACSGSLTCVAPHATEVRVGVSVDQLASRVTRLSTPLPSLQAGAELVAYPSCEPAAPCDLMGAISWEAPDRPLPAIDDPIVLFHQLTAGSDPEASAQEIVRRRARRASVLDAVLEQSAGVRQRAGGEDRVRLDAWLDSVRELERRAEATDARACPQLTAPPDPVDPTAHADLVADLMVAALACDRTRVITFMLGKGQSKRDMTFLGYPGEHHVASHHFDEPERMDVLADLTTWEIERFGYLLRRLRDTPEGSGTLLDSCAIQLLADLSDPNAHSHEDLPVLLAGGAGGAWRHGKHLDVAGEPLARLHLAMLQLVDPAAREFAEARSALPGLG